MLGSPERDMLEWPTKRVVTINIWNRELEFFNVGQVQNRCDIKSGSTFAVCKTTEPVDVKSDGFDARQSLHEIARSMACMAVPRRFEAPKY